MSANAELASAIRRLNARLGQLDPEEQRALQDDWFASWSELTRQREQAPDQAAELEVVANWERHWHERLG